MPLITCPDCGKEVSDKAASCIHCGCPIKASEPSNEQPGDKIREINGIKINVDELIRKHGTDIDFFADELKDITGISHNEAMRLAALAYKNRGLKGTSSKKWYQRKASFGLRLFAAIFFGMCVFISLSMIFFNDFGSTTQSSGEYITLKEFNAIETGMSYKQVVEIIGGEGQLLSEVDLDIGNEYKTEIYSWDGSGGLGANANVTFQGGKVTAKAQFGLE